jgi:hypothetical protein
LREIVGIGQITVVIGVSHAARNQKSGKDSGAQQVTDPRAISASNDSWDFPEHKAVIDAVARAHHARSNISEVFAIFRSCNVTVKRSQSNALKDDAAGRTLPKAGVFVGLALIERNKFCAIGVMAKAPVAGRSKTRLCPPLSPEQAAALSAGFLRDTFENVGIASRSAPITAYAAYAPRGCEELLRSVIGPDAELLLADGSPPMPDGVDGFGRCLFQAVGTMLTAGYAAACVLSSDSPSLPSRVLSEAARILLAPGDRAVLGATRDGGYYLLGVKTAHAHLFRNIAWSTSSVADETRARAREIGLALTELEVWYDVDDAESLAMLLREQTSSTIARTNEVIERSGLRGMPQLRTMAGAAP